MKQDTPTISAQVRDRSGTRYAQRLRKQGRLPGVLYGHQTDPVSVSVDEKEIVGLISHGAQAMFLDIEGKERETCLVKDLQYGFLGDNIIHVDFTRVNMDETVTVNVHLTFVGVAAESQKPDAILRQELTELSVNCKVLEIPEEIRVDLSQMDGLQLSAAEIKLPPGLTLDEDPEALVASVSFLREEEEPEGEEVELETEAGGEPEVITEAKDDDD